MEDVSVLMLLILISMSMSVLMLISLFMSMLFPLSLSNVVVAYHCPMLFSHVIAHVIVLRCCPKFLSHVIFPCHCLTFHVVVPHCCHMLLSAGCKQTLPKLNQLFSKTDVTLEPIMRFWCPLESRLSEPVQHCTFLSLNHQFKPFGRGVAIKPLEKKGTLINESMNECGR